MRLKITMTGKCLPRSQIKIIPLRLIKESLSISDTDYKDLLYSERKPKPLNYNLVLSKNRTEKVEQVQIGDFKIEDMVYYFPDGEIYLYVSSSDLTFVINLYNGLNKFKMLSSSTDEDIYIGNSKIEYGIRQIEMIHEKTITNNQINFKTQSSILIENDNRKPILPSELDEYNLHLNRIQDIIFKSLRGYGLKEPLVFTPIQMSKQVITHTINEFRKKTGKPMMYFTTSKGIFNIKGHPEDIDLLYKNGIGNRTSQGFGMVDIAS